MDRVTHTCTCTILTYHGMLAVPRYMHYVVLTSALCYIDDGFT